MERKTALTAYPQVGVASTCRSYEEYCAMFRLPGLDGVRGPVLDVAGGASCFTAELNAQGIPAFAADPFYDGSTEDVIAAARQEIEVSSAKIAANADIYDWSFYGSPEQHRAIREKSLERFAEHFRDEEGRKRYYSDSLPKLPFANDTFELVTCSHFLFLYADSFGQQFHLDAIAELIRVLRPGGELRIYPLISLKWENNPYISDIIKALSDVAQAEYLPSALPFTPVRSPLLRMVKMA
ncbi:class I SAM-dependent methyltransferase [Cohnella endophytica]|uniref:Class I SAM-dependent methyltransferase n=1 Tax=Cohnella endophytica TaxID=2419778 RepID=A0A494XYV3_9BACL|nr:class I SAM-dependent methyltransferase [Cohnella endophytica]RKP55129.1 class I SAM-dependent methyltransferase [Cohnella endophytica]